MYTHLVKTGVITLEKLIEIMAINPRKRFNIPQNGVTVWNLEEEFTVDPEKFLYKGKATPYKGKKLYGVCEMTVMNNQVKYIKE